MSRYYVIEKNVNMEDVVWGAAKQAPFGSMGIGDSFMIPEEEVQAVRNAASRERKKTGRVFTVRKRKEDDGYRCWRVK